MKPCYFHADSKQMEAIKMEQNGMYDDVTAAPPRPSTAHTDAIQLQPNVVYGVSTQPDKGNQTTYYENEGLSAGEKSSKQDDYYDYVQL